MYMLCSRNKKRFRVFLSIIFISSLCAACAGQKPAKTESAKTEPRKTESSRAETSKTEASKAEPSGTEPAKTAKAEPTETEPVRSTTGQPAATDAADARAALGGKPLWAQGAQTDGKLFEHLNLDGVGDADDAAYVSTYQFGDFEEERVIVLQMHLGTGETLSEIFPVYGHYTFQTGRLFSKDKEAVVLEVMVPASNYGAAHIFAVDVFNADKDHPTASAAVRLDTTVDTVDHPFTLVSGERSLAFSMIIWDTEVINVKGRPLQALKVRALRGDDVWHQKYSILYWTGAEYRVDDGWSIIAEGDILEKQD